LPPSVEAGGLLGPNLTALVAYLKGKGQWSYTRIQSFLEDMTGQRFSTGLLAPKQATNHTTNDVLYKTMTQRVTSDLPLIHA
jgi:hypothetical protein